MMVVGTVKWFNKEKGFGFISPDHTAVDIFIHVSELQKAGIREIRDGQRLRFEEGVGRNGKSSAVNVAVV